MARFFVAASNIFGGAAYIGAEETEHFRALRIRNGETFTVCNGEGVDYTCRLKGITRDGAEAEIVSEAPSAGEPGIYATVFAAMSKGDKLDSVVQKSVELGAAELVIFPSSRCVARPEGAALIKKTARLQKIAAEAAKQSERGRIPRVTAAPSFDMMIARASMADIPLFCYEEERTRAIREVLERIPNARTASIVTGPEGGFDPEEAQYASSCGMVSVSLGPRILRCETAPLFALSAVMLLTNNL